MFAISQGVLRPETHNRIETSKSFTKMCIFGVCRDLKFMKNFVQKLKRKFCDLSICFKMFVSICLENCLLNILPRRHEFLISR